MLWMVMLTEDEAFSLSSYMLLLSSVSEPLAHPNDLVL